MLYPFLLLTACVFSVIPVLPGSAKTAPEVKLEIIYDSTAYPAGNDTIDYNPARPLTWSDFKGPVPANITAAANSAVGFRYRASITGSSKTLNIQVRIACFFVRQLSWVKQPNRSDALLAHEQRHFDIARLGMEAFRKKLEAARFTPETVGQLLNGSYREAMQACNELQDKYDTETNHHLNTPKQEEWNGRIAGWLNALR